MDAALSVPDSCTNNMPHAAATLTPVTITFITVSPVTAIGEAATPVTMAAVIVLICERRLMERRKDIGNRGSGITRVFEKNRASSEDADNKGQDKYQRGKNRRREEI